MPLPNMVRSLSGIGVPCRFRIVSKAVQDHQVTESESRDSYFNAAMMPMTAQELRIKPEGQRNLMWWTLFTTQKLYNDDFLKDVENRNFRVMKKENWGSYFKYDAVEAPRTAIV